MYPAPFDYHAPASLEEALETLSRLGPDAKVLAGGASLIPLMKLRLAEPAHLVDIGRVPGLDAISFDDGTITLGAMVRESQLAASPVAAQLRVVADACAVIADPLVRNVGTVGGNVAHGDPANDHPAVMLALDAVAVARSTRGDREIRAEAFHLGLFETALQADEVLVALRLPVPDAGTGSAYVKFERQVGDFAMAAAAAVLHTRDGRADHVRVALTNVGPTPVRSRAVEEALAGREPTDEAIAEAVSLLGDELEPWGDLRATVEAKRSMAAKAAARALRRARDRAGSVAGPAGAAA